MVSIRIWRWVELKFLVKVVKKRFTFLLYIPRRRHRHFLAKFAQSLVNVAIFCFQFKLKASQVLLQLKNSTDTEPDETTKVW